jgi:REP element-mobilizing transposase RayT
VPSPGLNKQQARRRTYFYLPLGPASSWTDNNTFIKCFYINFFDPDADYQVYRRNLPHRRQTGVTYFVTFHLADSLPAQKRAALAEERKLWLALNPPPHNHHQIAEYHRNFSKRLHRWLDAGYGSCVLAKPEIYRLAESVLTYFDGSRYALGEYVVMPNHVHALVQPSDAYPLDRIVHSWKSFSANQINKMTGSRGRLWHPESFDHIVRSAVQLERIEEYIRDNPKSLPFDNRAAES